MKTGLGQVKHLSTVETVPLSSRATAELEGWVLANDIGMMRKRFFFLGGKTAGNGFDSFASYFAMQNSTLSWTREWTRR